MEYVSLLSSVVGVIGMFLPFILEVECSIALSTFDVVNISLLIGIPEYMDVCSFANFSVIDISAS